MFCISNFCNSLERETIIVFGPFFQQMNISNIGSLCHCFINQYVHDLITFSWTLSKSCYSWFRLKNCTVLCQCISILIANIQCNCKFYPFGPGWIFLNIPVMQSLAHILITEKKTKASYTTTANAIDFIFHSWPLSLCSFLNRNLLNVPTTITTLYDIIK